MGDGIQMSFVKSEYGFCIFSTVCFRLALLYIYLHCHLEITTGVKTCSVADMVEFHSYINSINTDG